MGFSHAKIFSVLILFQLCSAVLFSQDSGTSATIADFAFPEYRKGTGELQFIIYGKKASNLGAFINITDPVLDIVTPHLRDITLIRPMRDARFYALPDFDKLDKMPENLRCAMLLKYDKAAAAFWQLYPQSQVVIRSSNATYDKNAKMLHGTGKAYFHSRYLDAEGVGFDADQERRFVHVRSRVRVVVRPGTRAAAEQRPRIK